MNENQAKVRVVDTAALLEEYRTLVQQVDMVPLVVSGSSMTPFLVHGRDTVYLSKVSRPLRRGDMVLYQRKSGAYILHRICRVRDGSFDIVGDAQTVIEHGVRREQIFAVVRAAKRKGRMQQPGCFWWTFFEKFWVRVIPLRPMLLRGYGALHRLWGRNV